MIRLCSLSTSRATLLNEFGIDFIQSSSSYDEEQITTKVAREFVYIASKGKLESSIKEFGLDLPLLCGDSVISTSSGEILRKPKSLDEAREILSKQSGDKISIISSIHYQSKDYLFTDISATHYHFDKFDLDDLDRYLESNLWQGKAGGCMVEGFCKKYIRYVDGLESTARGLQVEKLINWII